MKRARGDQAKTSVPDSDKRKYDRVRVDQEPGITYVFGFYGFVLWRGLRNRIYSQAPLCTYILLGPFAKLHGDLAQPFAVHPTFAVL